MRQWWSGRRRGRARGSDEGATAAERCNGDVVTEVAGLQNARGGVAGEKGQERTGHQGGSPVETMVQLSGRDGRVVDMDVVYAVQGNGNLQFSEQEDGTMVTIFSSAEKEIIYSPILDGPGLKQLRTS